MDKKPQEAEERVEDAEEVTAKRSRGVKGSSRRNSDDRAVVELQPEDVLGLFNERFGQISELPRWNGLTRERRWGGRVFEGRAKYLWEYAGRGWELHAVRL